MKKVLVFDFDGTVADSFENFLEIIEKLAVKYKFPSISDTDVDKLRAIDARTLVRRLGIPFYKIPFIARDMKLLQQQKIAEIKPFKGLPKVLSILKDKGYSLGIITSNSKENVRFFLDNNNLDIFNFLHSDSGIFGKDKVIDKFLRQNNLEKSEVAYIGDEIRDIQACKRIGIKVVAVSWGFNSKEGLLTNSPDFIIEKPEELLALF